MPKRILLADDSITIQKVVELTFSDGDYEVTAVNNGAKAIQKLSEMRPDIILSDIIMPEKNGYEVCEHVKSHPEYRNIPVVLLTGTFEPFDPDRAEKAGCDAVVTKPFESQSLIHKVEELIAAAQSAPVAAPVAVPEPEPEAPSPWMDDDEPATTEVSAPMPFTTSGGSLPTPPEAYTHDSDIFNAAPAPEATTEMPFEATADSPFAGETRAFPRMSFDDFPPVTPPPSEPSPWDEQDLGGETRAFGKINVDDLQSMQQPLETEAAHDDPQPEPQFGAPEPQFAPPDPQPEPQFAAPDPQPEPQFAPPDPQPDPQFASPASEPDTDSPFGEPPPAEDFSSETRAFQRMSFDELQQQMSTPGPEPLPEPEPEPEPQQPAAQETSPWDEPADMPAPMFSSGSDSETRAIPTMSFDDFPPPMAEEPRPEPQAEASPWDEQPAFGGETRAFPKMSFDDLAAMAPTPEPQATEPEPEQTPAPWDAPAAPAWTSAEEAPSAPVDTFSSRAYTPFTPTTEPEPQQTSDAAMPEDLPFATETTGQPEVEEEPETATPFTTVPPPAEEQAIWPEPIAAAEAAAESDEPVVPPPALAPETAASLPIRSAELSEEQVDRIARRVVELMSDQVVRNIAWEVIPDLAEMVVKERIRQLESEA